MWFALLLAEGAPAGGQPGGGGLLEQLGPFVPLLAILFLGYLFLWRPVRRQEAERKAMVAALKENDKVINSGGIIGVVASIKEKEDEVVLKGGVRITKSSIVRIVRDDSAKE